MFLAKTSRFIVVTVSLTEKMVDPFRLVNLINRLVPADSRVFIPDEQVVDHFTWYAQAIDWFNLKSSFSSLCLVNLKSTKYISIL